MYTRQLLGVVTLALLWSGAPAFAQGGSVAKPGQTSRAQPDPDTIALVQLVDAAIVASPTPQNEDGATGEIPLRWESAHVIRGQNGVYIPFTVSFDAEAIRSSDLALYIRAVPRAQLPAVVAALAPQAPSQGAKPQASPAVPKYAWDNVYFLQKPADGRIMRAIAVAPGEYDLFIAVKERSTTGSSAATAAGIGARNGVLRHPFTAPDFDKPELQTSSVILASTVEPVSRQLTPAEQESNPYVFGPMRIVPARDARFTKGSELQVIFWVYGAMAAANGKPDVSIEYNFHVKQPDGSEKFFNKTEPQQLNAQTLPPEFSVAAGHQLPGSLVVALAPFPEGDYRLEIKVTDRPTGKTVTQDVNFTVTA